MTHWGSSNQVVPEELVRDSPEERPISIPRSYFIDVDGRPTSVSVCGICDSNSRQELSQTIPRLELSSLFQFSPSCYTDSQVALYWIHGTSKAWKSFIQNRFHNKSVFCVPRITIHPWGAINGLMTCRNYSTTTTFESDCTSYKLFVDNNGVWRCGGETLQCERVV